MALLIACSFGLQSIALGMEFNGLTGTPTVETTISRSNATALRFASGALKQIQWNTYSSGQGVKYYRAYFYIVSAPNANADIISIDNGANLKVALRVTSTLTAQLFNSEDGAQIGATYSTLSTGAWYRFELKIDSTTLASTAVEARLYAASDEATLLWNPSGTANLAADPNRLSITNRNNATLDFVVTDITINDDAGSVLNTWMGEGSIVYLRPSGAGASTQWSRGGADSGANWSQVEETPPNDVTDYVESNTSGQTDDYALTDTPAAVASGDDIKWVAPGMRFTVSNLTGAEPEFVLRVTAGGNTEESAAIVGNSTSWFSYANGSTLKPPLVLTDMPGASTSAWTKSALDGAEAGIRETLTDAHFARVSALWLMAEHKAGTGGGGGTAVPVFVHHMKQQGMAQ